MAHWVVTLEADWWSRRTTGADTSYVQWEPPQGSRPQVTGGLLAAADDESFLSRFVMDQQNDPARIVIHIAGSQTGGILGGRNDLSDAWESNHRVKVTAGTRSWELATAAADDPDEHYIYNIPTDTVTPFDEFVQAMSAQTEAELILWDGQGDNPFEDAAVIGWLGASPVTKAWLGGVETTRQWLGTSQLN